MIFYEKKKDKSMSTTTVPVSRKNGHIAKNDNEKFRIFFDQKKEKKAPKNNNKLNQWFLHVYMSTTN